MQHLRLGEEPVPGVHILLLQRALAAVHHLIEAAGLHAVLDRPDRSIRRLVQMRQEHGFGTPVPHLLGTDIHRFPPGV